MRTQNKLAVGLLSLGLALAPFMAPSSHAADEPAPGNNQPRQNQGGRGQRNPTAMLDRMQKQVTDLGLSDEQKPKVEAAFADAKKKLEEATKDAGTDRAAIRDKTQPIIKDLNDKVNGILTPEQREKLDKAREAARAQRGNRNGGQGGQNNNNNSNNQQK